LARPCAAGGICGVFPCDSVNPSYTVEL